MKRFYSIIFAFSSIFAVNAQHRISSGTPFGFENVQNQSWERTYKDYNQSGISAICEDTLLFEDFQSKTIPATWINIDNDGATDANGKPQDWYTSADLMTTIGVDTNWVASASSWFTPAGTANNWLIISDTIKPCASTNLMWKSAPFEGPGFMDGYKVLISTTGINMGDFTDTVFVVAEDIGGGSGTPGIGMVHTNFNGSRGVLQEWQTTLGVYDGMSIFIAFVHDSNDDNLIQIDDIFVGECPDPVALFGYSSNELVVSFTDSSTVTPTANWMWDFGDGNTSTMQNPNHTYAAAGTYTACLTIIDACGNNTICTGVTVASCPDPVALFGYSSNELVVSFTDSSTVTVTSWMWDFGDGDTSTQQNPNHTYTAAGTYTTCLIVTDACGADTVCTTITVSCPDPVGLFGYSSNELVVSFTDSSTVTVTSWMWDFGDGNTSTLQNPNHSYATTGTYTVCLIVTDACDADTVCTAVTVNTTVGVNSQNELSNINIYPSPAKDFLVINELNIYEHYDISIFNNIGSLIKIINSNGVDKVQIQLANIPAGFYSLRVVSKNKIATIPFVISR